MKVVYIGELSGVRVEEINLTFMRGQTVEAPDAWAKESILKDPTRWRMATDEEAAQYDEAQAVLRRAEALRQEQADEVSLAHAMEEDAKLRALEEPATGGGGTNEPTMEHSTVEIIADAEADDPASRTRKRKHEE